MARNSTIFICYGGVIAACFGVIAYTGQITRRVIVEMLVSGIAGGIGGGIAWVRHRKLHLPADRLASIDFGRIARTLSKIRLALGAIFAVVATGWFLFDYFTRPNLGIGLGLTLGAMIAALGFVSGWLPGLGATWLLKWLDWLFSP